MLWAAFVHPVPLPPTPVRPCQPAEFICTLQNPVLASLPQSLPWSQSLSLQYVIIIGAAVAV